MFLNFARNNKIVKRSFSTLMSNKIQTEWSVQNLSILNPFTGVKLVHPWTSRYLSRRPCIGNKYLFHVLQNIEDLQTSKIIISTYNVLKMFYSLASYLLQNCAKYMLLASEMETCCLAALCNLIEGVRPALLYNFKSGLGLERGPPSLLRTIG